MVKVELRIGISDILIIVMFIAFFYIGYLIWRRWQELIRPVTYEEAIATRGIETGTIYYWGVT